MRESWATRAGFILAAIGSAIGLGNIWRFSYLAHANGGGAFLIPYFIALFVTGISLLMVEFALGHKFKASAPMAMRQLGRKFEWIGWWAVLSAFIITTYYVVVLGWALVYFTKSFTLAWGADTESYFFGNVLQLSNSPWAITGFALEVLIAVIVLWLINWFVVFRGVKKGIEKANLIMMPLLWILAIILVIRAVTLPGALEGLEWYLRPDFSKMGDYKIWIAAFGQIFFSLSLAMGIMIAYGSYLPEKSDVANNSFIVGLADSAFSFLIGFAVFGTLGYMAFVTQTSVENVVASGVGLAFIVFPQALNLMPTLPHLIAAIFFLTLIVAGLSSSISLVEAITSSIMDKFKVSRTKAVNTVFVLGFLGSLIFTTTAGLYWLDIVDHFINYYGLVLVALLEVIAVAWFFNLSSLKEHINSISEIKIGSWWNWALKYATVIVLAVLLILDIWGNLQKPYGDYPIDVLATGVLVIIFGMFVSALLTLRRGKDVA
ncbi:MAG: sodium-dependent transporter [Archaeoglobaceae archaeon]|nr:sodium-dependent transporter [Archaeoglobaceae archaeon]MDW8118659.1 sodium-dependent transporter [Archaeoglobaceae archaeon]